MALEIQTRSDSPFGAGIAGSSALNIAVCGALMAWSGQPRTDAEIMQIAMNVEAQAIDVPTGVQDYRPALYGGISAVELGVDGVRRVALPVEAPELERRLVLAYTGATRNSGINNWEVTKRHIDGDVEVQRRFARIRDIAGAMRSALERRRVERGGPADCATNGKTARASRPAWRRRRSTPSSPRRGDAGAYGGKVCGAGGGGCLFCLGEPDRIPAIRDAIAADGGRLLDFTIETEGLRVDTRRSLGVSRAS